MFSNFLSESRFGNENCLTALYSPTISFAGLKPAFDLSKLESDFDGFESMEELDNLSKSSVSENLKPFLARMADPEQDLRGYENPTDIQQTVPNVDIFCLGNSKDSCTNGDLINNQASNAALVGRSLSSTFFPFIPSRSTSESFLTSENYGEMDMDFIDQQPILMPNFIGQQPRAEALQCPSVVRLTKRLYNSSSSSSSEEDELPTYSEGQESNASASEDCIKERCSTRITLADAGLKLFGRGSREKLTAVQRKMLEHKPARGRRRCKQLAVMTPVEIQLEKAMRLEKSRLSARDSRLRKKSLVNILQKEINEFKKRESRAQKEIQGLKHKNKSLQQILENMQGLLKGYGHYLLPSLQPTANVNVITRGKGRPKRIFKNTAGDGTTD